ncbi:MAG: coproporphyrinogen-III oxidase family protein, partial [Candidatus Omnitrophota bacterium]|nr:coproporphyrinogen-III oxidase family protein [Candidatus Omnitrophota bacterium]
RDQAVAAYQAVREAGFDNVNVDMMFGFPNQTLEELEQDIQDFMALNSDHMSLYELTIEEPSRFFVKNVKGLDGPLRQKQYEIVLNRLQEYGFKQYEISNFAQPGKQSAHNRNYWQGGDYLGLGVGAHSHTSGKRGWNVSRLADYLQRLAQAQPVIEEEETLTESQRLAETLLFGLRMNEGVDVPYLEKRFGCVLNDGQKEKIGVFVKENLLVQQGAQLSVSAKGRFVLDELSVQLMPS